MHPSWHMMGRLERRGMQSLTLLLKYSADYIKHLKKAYLGIPAAWWIHPERAMGSSHQSVKPGLWQRPAKS